MSRYAVLGVGIWLAATVALRIVGQIVFDNPVWLFTVSLVAMAALPAVMFRNLADPGQRARAAIALATPGMLLDTVSALAFPVVFPNIRTEAAGMFGGWLLFCNAVVLLAAVARSPLSSRA
jgi:hypothetical protein